MNARTFQSGNSVALRLPKALGVGPNEHLTVERSGDIITARILPTFVEEAERLRRFREMLDAIKRIGPVDEVEDREPIEFHERPGL